MKNVDVKTLKNWLDNEEVVLIDVREIEENNNQRIADAILIPLAEITKEKLPDIKNKKLVIHCQGGKRSLLACQKLLAEDIDCEIFNLEGGINAWFANGCETISGNKKSSS